MTSNTKVDMNSESKNESPNSFIFKVGESEQPVIIIDEKGFWYRDQLVEDAGEVYRLFREFISGANR